MMADRKPLASWTSSLGKDKYGYWANLEIKEVKQRFRWIEAGEFTMGSPEDEPERFDREKQHEVKLTEGYWLADTVCTQELWQLVMDNNPSEFKGKDLPVETVSWNDVNSFIKKMNNLIGDNIFNLPTEAQWEYACRAGTNTPFSFGNTIDSKQVNFNGNYLYNNSQESEYRKKTIGVKELDCNEWGLYQLHGNVWEWCNDLFRQYDKKEEVGINQRKGSSHVYRILRGGLWNSLAKHCRSAYCVSARSESRYRLNGFRLSSGHPVQAK